MVLAGCAKDELQTAGNIGSASETEASEKISYGAENEISSKKDSNEKNNGDTTNIDVSMSASTMQQSYEMTDNNKVESTTVRNDSNKSDAVEDKTASIITDENELSEKTDTTYSQQKEDNYIFTVVFKDYDGTVLKKEKVKKGEDASAPIKPSREGYKFIQWDTYFKNVERNITVTAEYEKITLPTLVVDEVIGKAGETVCIKVNVKNNPGLLAMVLNITFDDKVMKLKNAENGKALSEYMFTAPKNMESGCNAAWSINEVPQTKQDGEVLILYFEVLENASKGDYPIMVSCLNNAFDNEYNVVPFDVINGTLNIK